MEEGIFLDRTIFAHDKTSLEISCAENKYQIVIEINICNYIDIAKGRMYMNAGCKIENI